MTTDPREMARAANKVPVLATSVPVQFGQSLQMRPSPANSALATVAKDVVRWKGVGESDIQPIRIYLGPWQPQPMTTPFVSPLGYAIPTPWAEPPQIFDSMVGEGVVGDFASMLYARVSFGGGGVQHQAFVDWPPRGLLFQVSASYVQVDGVGRFAGFDPQFLPRLLAHASVEPGGGDAVNSATFTYPAQFAPGAANSLVFQAPPFARAFTPILDRQALIVAGVTSIGFQQLGMSLAFTGQSHEWDPALGEDWPDDRAIPLVGTAGGVRAIGAAGDAFFGGMLFHLDL